MNVSKSKPRLPRVLLVLAVVAVVASAWWLWRSPSSEVRFRSAKLEVGDVSVTISATGSLKALSTVDIGSQISGQIAEVAVDFNEQVSKGQVLARIDPANLRSASDPGARRSLECAGGLARGAGQSEECRSRLRSQDRAVGATTGVAQRVGSGPGGTRSVACSRHVGAGRPSSSATRQWPMRRWI
jgi:HlyD family secretion protein